MPALIVLRHSKAASPLGTPDIDRPLAGRGRRDAKAAGDHLRAGGLVPERIICSPALRTRQTLEGLALDAPAEIDSRVYDNDVDDLLDLLREQPDDPRTLLLIGHNPSVHQLVHDLTGTADGSFPTSATAVIEFDGTWSDLAPGAGRLVAFWTPRG